MDDFEAVKSLTYASITNIQLKWLVLDMRCMMEGRYSEESYLFTSHRKKRARIVLSHKGIAIFSGYSAVISRTVVSTCAMTLLYVAMMMLDQYSVRFML